LNSVYNPSNPTIFKELLKSTSCRSIKCEFLHLLASVAWSILFSDTILVLSFGKLSPLDPECLRVRLVERQARDTFSPKKLEARLLE
jgi:hypothetical protein